MNHQSINESHSRNRLFIQWIIHCMSINRSIRRPVYDSNHLMLVAIEIHGLLCETLWHVTLVLHLLQWVYQSLLKPGWKWVKKWGRHIDDRHQSLKSVRLQKRALEVQSRSFQASLYKTERMWWYWLTALCMDYNVNFPCLMKTLPTSDSIAIIGSETTKRSPINKSIDWLADRQWLNICFMVDWLKDALIAVKLCQSIKQASPSSYQFTRWLVLRSHVDSAIILQSKSVDDRNPPKTTWNQKTT